MITRRLLTLALGLLPTLSWATGEFDLGAQIADDLLAAGANCNLTYDLWRAYDGSSCTDAAGCDAAILQPLLIPQSNNGCSLNLKNGRLWMHSGVIADAGNIKLHGAGSGATTLYIAQNAPSVDNTLDLFTVTGGGFEMRGMSVTNAYGLTGYTDNVRNGGAVIRGAASGGRVIDVTLKDTYEGFNLQNANADGWTFRDVTALTQPSCPDTKCMWNHLFVLGGIPQPSLTTAGVNIDHLYIDFRDSTYTGKLLGEPIWIGAGIDTATITNSTIYAGGYQSAIFVVREPSLGLVPRWVHVQTSAIENSAAGGASEACVLLYAGLDFNFDSSSCINAQYGIYSQGGRKLKVTNSTFANLDHAGVVMTPRVVNGQNMTVADSVLIQGNDFGSIARSADPGNKSAIVVADPVSRFQIVKNSFANIPGFSATQMYYGVEIMTGTQDDWVVEHNVADTASMTGSAVSNSSSGTHKTCTLENGSSC